MRMHRAAQAGVWLMLAGPLASGLAAAQQGVLPVPALSGRVIDQTGTLSAADRDALQQQLAALETRTGSQLVVLMVPTTAPEDIAAYAQRVADSLTVRGAAGSAMPNSDGGAWPTATSRCQSPASSPIAEAATSSRLATTRASDTRPTRSRRRRRQASRQAPSLPLSAALLIRCARAGRPACTADRRPG
jgi:hypothetical protein